VRTRIDGIAFASEETETDAHRSDQPGLVTTRREGSTRGCTPSTEPHEGQGEQK
jgi:hypothetical protein